MYVLLLQLNQTSQGEQKGKEMFLMGHYIKGHNKPLKHVELVYCSVGIQNQVAFTDYKVHLWSLPNQGHAKLKY